MKKLFVIIILLLLSKNNASEYTRYRRYRTPVKYFSCAYDLLFCCMKCKWKCSPTHAQEIVDFTLNIRWHRHDEGEEITLDDQNYIMKYINKFIANGGNLDQTVAYDALENKSLADFFRAYKCYEVVELVRNRKLK